jgi:hypothetical protein
MENRLFKLGRRRDTEGDTARKSVLAMVVRALGGNPDIVVAVNEIVCADPACPGTETIILVMVPGKPTAACKVGKPIRDVSDDDVRDALRELTYAPVGGTS